MKVFNIITQNISSFNLELRNLSFDIENRQIIARVNNYV